MKGITVYVKDSEEFETANQCPTQLRYSCSCTPGIEENSIVCGRYNRSEIDSEDAIYNKLCDWGIGDKCSDCKYRVDIPREKETLQKKTIIETKEDYIVELIDKAATEPRFVR